jgi:hypothetical protein
MIKWKRHTTMHRLNESLCKGAKWLFSQIMPPNCPYWLVDVFPRDILVQYFCLSLDIPSSFWTFIYRWCCKYISNGSLLLIICFALIADINFTFRQCDMHGAIPIAGSYLWQKNEKTLIMKFFTNSFWSFWASDSKIHWIEFVKMHLQYDQVVSVFLFQSNKYTILIGWTHCLFQIWRCESLSQLI